MSIQDDDMTRRLRHAADTLDEDEDNAPMFAALMRRAATTIVALASELAARDEQINQHKAETVHLAISVQQMKASAAAARAALTKHQAAYGEEQRAVTVSVVLPGSNHGACPHDPPHRAGFEDCEPPGELGLEGQRVKSATRPATRVRYLGSASQWGDGGEFHGWQVSAAGRWRAPATDDERALVRRCTATEAQTECPVAPEALDTATRGERERVLALAVQMQRDCSGLHSTLGRRLEALITDIKCGARTYP